MSGALHWNACQEPNVKSLLNPVRPSDSVRTELRKCVKGAKLPWRCASCAGPVRDRLRQPVHEGAAAPFERVNAARYCSVAAEPSHSKILTALSHRQCTHVLVRS